MNERKQLNNRSEAFEVYESCTKDIDSPWPFPPYWTGDFAEFEVSHGGEMGGTCDVRVGRIIAVFETQYGELEYQIKSDGEKMDISYFAFYGNWTPGEVLREKFKCIHCGGSGLSKEAEKSLKKARRCGKEGYNS